MQSGSAAPTLPYADSEATAFSRRGAPCMVAPHNMDGRIKSVEVVGGPRNGKFRCGAQPGCSTSRIRNSREPNSFTFRVLRTTDANEVAASIVNLTVNVD